MSFLWMVFQSLKPMEAVVLFADFAIDDYVKLTFKGLAVTKAELVTPIRGKVTAVNAASTSLTVQDFTGKSQVINAGSNYSVKLNGGVDWSFSSIKVGDRVQVMKDVNDKLLIQVAVASKREFDQYSYVVEPILFQSCWCRRSDGVIICSQEPISITALQVVLPSSFVSGDQVTFTC